MATAKKLPSGSWRCLVYDYTDDSGKRVYRSFTSEDPSPAGKRKAEALAAQYAVEKELKKHSMDKSLFSDRMESYITSKEAVLSPATIRGYRNIQKMLLRDHAPFCRMEIRNISQDDVQRVINSLSRSKSPKTVRNYHGLIASVVGSDLALRTSKPQKIRPKLYIPSDDDIKALVDAVQDTELEIPVLLGAFCMMRRGEICALTLDDIQGDVIHVHHSLVLGTDKDWHLKAPKTGSSDRYISAPAFVTDRIRVLGHITTLNPHSITIMFQRALRRANITHFRFHDLRHYSASIRHALGIPDAYIMQEGGWKTDTVLKSVYRHAMSDRQKEMARLANNHFSRLCNTKCNMKK